MIHLLAGLSGDFCGHASADVSRGIAHLVRATVEGAELGDSNGLWRTKRRCYSLSRCCESEIRVTQLVGSQQKSADAALSTRKAVRWVAARVRGLGSECYGWVMRMRVLRLYANTQSEASLIS